jgi:hypothetical protein
LNLIIAPSLARFALRVLWLCWVVVVTGSAPRRPTMNVANADRELACQ